MSDVLTKKIDDLREMVELDIQSRSAHKSDILAAVENQVKITVNGKIDKIALHLGEQDKKLETILTEQARIKKDTDPLINGKKWIWELFKGVLWVSGGVTTVGGAYLIIKQIWP